MHYKISGSEAFSVLDFEMEQGDAIVAQPKSMVSMTTGIEVSAILGGVTGSGTIGGSMKGLLAGENIALSVYSSNKPTQSITIAPQTIGPILPIDLKENQDLLIAKGSYLASESEVTLKTEFTGFKGFMAKKGLFLVRASGPGTVFLSAYGDIREKTLATDERYVIDNDFVVAFDSSVSYQLVTAAKGLTNSFLSGEGLVNRYTGPGKVYYQTRAKTKNGMMSLVFNSLT